VGGGAVDAGQMAVILGNSAVVNSSSSRLPTAGDLDAMRLNWGPYLWMRCYNNGAQFLDRVVGEKPDWAALEKAASACPPGCGGTSVRPFSSPEPSPGLTATEAAAFPAVQLFVERVSAIVEDFALTDANASLVVAICRRLDGLPLAIEFAAPRVEALGVEGLAARLDDCLRRLSGAQRRAAMPRHRTMQAVIDALRLTPDLRAVVCNVEMPPTILLDRQLARLSGVDATLIRYRRLDGTHANRIDQAMNTLDTVADLLTFVLPPFDLANVAASAAMVRWNAVSRHATAVVPAKASRLRKRPVAGS